MIGKRGDGGMSTQTLVMILVVLIIALVVVLVIKADLFERARTLFGGKSSSSEDKISDASAADPVIFEKICSSKLAEFSGGVFYINGVKTEFLWKKGALYSGSRVIAKDEGDHIKIVDKNAGIDSLSGALVLETTGGKVFLCKE